MSGENAQALVIKNTNEFQSTIPEYKTIKHQVVITARLGRRLYISHKITAHKSTPNTLMTQKYHSPIRVSRNGFPSRPKPCLTRNWLIKPSETTRATSTPRR